MGLQVRGGFPGAEALPLHAPGPFETRARRTLYLYISVSRSAVSGVLIREDRGDQKPIFYVSKTLDDTETRYPTLKKLALVVVTPTQSGRIAKWAVELSEYDIEYRNRTCEKSQVLADFLIELPPDMIGADPNVRESWTLHVDGSSSRNGSGIGIRLESPTGEILEQSFRLAFPASNNEAEYEALIAGCAWRRRSAPKNCKRTATPSSSPTSSAENTSPKTIGWTPISKWLSLGSRVRHFRLTKIPRSDNSSADALAALASTSDPDYAE
ncbi:unnamed protein product [Microthlaspi erraticum]|uniref:Reverse transcriptase/retrotransposon-derived protein RNase H-like domain-containing protein n=1 Tax=Microthlaspi erraticum TaxID=1685480 RepID=A0A6D2IDJ5_9BRAS|nr:unnamed protein product [Microthlaspi erraticum]